MSGYEKTEMGGSKGKGNVCVYVREWDAGAHQTIMSYHAHTAQVRAVKCLRKNTTMPSSQNFKGKCASLTTFFLLAHAHTCDATGSGRQLLMLTPYLSFNTSFSSTSLYISDTQSHKRQRTTAHAHNKVRVRASENIRKSSGRRAGARERSCTCWVIALQWRTCAKTRERSHLHPRSCRG